MTVYISPAMFSSKSDQQICFEGTKIELMCSVYAKYIEVKWNKERQEIHNCRNIMITRGENCHMLTIEKSSVKDSGTYYVTAGTVQTEIPVTVKGNYDINT